MKRATIIVSLLLAGCISIDTELQLPNAGVLPTLTGEDCVDIILGFGFGTVHVRDAMRSHTERYYGAPRIANGPMINRVHSIVLKDEAGLGFGRRCIEVKGEARP